MSDQPVDEPVYRETHMRHALNRTVTKTSEIVNDTGEIIKNAGQKIGETQAVTVVKDVAAGAVDITKETGHKIGETFPAVKTVAGGAASVAVDIGKAGADVVVAAGEKTAPVVKEGAYDVGLGIKGWFRNPLGAPGGAMLPHQAGGPRQDLRE